MQSDIQNLFDAGTHFGFTRARRHPSAAAFLFGNKDRTDIFDLEETQRRLDAARAFVTSLGKRGAQILFVAGKNEAQDALKSAALSCGTPYVAGRWIGGTLTNFKNVRKRIERLQKLMQERDSGELAKYTKRERLLIDREIDELLGRFGGLVGMNDLPAALFVVDPRHEHTAVKEANQLGIPVVALANSDCDFSLIRYPIPGNDTSIRSIKLVVADIARAYEEGKNSPERDEKKEEKDAKTS